MDVVQPFADLAWPATRLRAKPDCANCEVLKLCRASAWLENFRRELCSCSTPANAKPRLTWRWMKRCWKPCSLVNAVQRFYGWMEPAATFGYFQKYSSVERATLLRPLVRRLTGGGIVPHDADWTYSFAVPPGHEWHSLAAIETGAFTNGFSTPREIEG